MYISLIKAIYVNLQADCRLQNQHAMPMQQHPKQPIIKRITWKKAAISMHKNTMVQIWMSSKTVLQIVFRELIFTRMPTTPAKKPPAPPKEACTIKGWIDHGMLVRKGSGDFSPGFSNTNNGQRRKKYLTLKLVVVPLAKSALTLTDYPLPIPSEPANW